MKTLKTLGLVGIILTMIAGISLAALDNVATFEGHVDVFGDVTSSQVTGNNPSTTGVAAGINGYGLTGVYGKGSVQGIFGETADANGYAGYFNGGKGVYVNGELGAKKFGDINGSFIKGTTLDIDEMSTSSISMKGTSLAIGRLGVTPPQGTIYLQAAKVGIGSVSDSDFLGYMLRVKGDILVSGMESEGAIIAGTNLVLKRFKAGDNVDNAPLYVDASGFVTTAGSNSDLRLKKNIENISTNTNVIAGLNNLRGVYYNWDLSQEKVKNLGENKRIGMIAQEVEKVLPELVGTDSDGYKTLDYAKMTAFLVEVNKAQQKQIEELKARVEKLEQK